MRTFIRSINPLALLFLGFASLASSFWIRDLEVALWAVAAYVLAVILFVPGWRYPLACLGFTSIAAISIVYSTWRLGGRDEVEALTAGLRIIVLAWPGSVVVGYVDPQRLSDYLAQRLHLPARPVVAFSAALQHVSNLGLTWVELDRVRRIRGTGPTANPITTTRFAGGMSFALLVQALRHASQNSIAMDARGFADARDRTWAEPAPWTKLDSIAMALAVALASVAPLASVLGG